MVSLSNHNNVMAAEERFGKNKIMNKIDPNRVGEVSKPRAPADLKKVLAVAPGVAALWKNLTPIARRDFISWIESAKQPETRKRRIERIPNMLIRGKRRPCCYAIVPMNVYKALGASPKAKAKWRDLTPNERRDFVNWIDGAKQPEVRKQRIKKVCEILAKGK